jgi:solute carrier family 25 protein 38
MYFTLLQKMRGVLAESRYFQRTLNPSLGSTTSVLPVLASHGNLLAGATARVTVGMLLNPVSIVKARYEVRISRLYSPDAPTDTYVQSDLHAFKNVFQAFSSVFTSGPRELLKGAGASALRDGPYAGLFLFSYEGAKEIWGGYYSTKVPSRLCAQLILGRLEPDAMIPPTVIHMSSGAAAGTFATLATHPFDVLKVPSLPVSIP